MNTVEYSSHYYAALLTAGVQYPVVAGIGGLIYNIGRIFYFKRYSSGDPEKRHLGSAWCWGGRLNWADLRHCGTPVQIGIVRQRAQFHNGVSPLYLQPW